MVRRFVGTGYIWYIIRHFDKDDDFCDFLFAFNVRTCASSDNSNQPTYLRNKNSLRIRVFDGFSTNFL